MCNLGLFAIQLAKLWKAGDITVTSSQIALCKEHGATRVVNYKLKKKTKKERKTILICFVFCVFLLDVLVQKSCLTLKKKKE